MINGSFYPYHGKRKATDEIEVPSAIFIMLKDTEYGFETNHRRFVFTTVKIDHVTSFLIRKSVGFIWYTYYVVKFIIIQFYDFSVTFSMTS